MQRNRCAIAAMGGIWSVDRKSMERGEKCLEPEADCSGGVGGVEGEVASCSWDAGDSCGGDDGREHWRLGLEKSGEVRVGGPE